MKLLDRLRELFREESSTYKIVEVAYSNDGSFILTTTVSNQFKLIYESAREFGIDINFIGKPLQTPEISKRRAPVLTIESLTNQRTLEILYDESLDLLYAVTQGTNAEGIEERFELKSEKGKINVSDTIMPEVAEKLALSYRTRFLEEQAHLKVTKYEEHSVDSIVDRLNFPMKRKL